MPAPFNGYQFQNGSEDSSLQNAANSAQTSRRIKEQSSRLVLDQHQRWQRGRWTAHIAIGGGGMFVVATDANGGKVGRMHNLRHVPDLAEQFPTKELDVVKLMLATPQNKKI